MAFLSSYLRTPSCVYPIAQYIKAVFMISQLADLPSSKNTIQCCQLEPTLHHLRGCLCSSVPSLTAGCEPMLSEIHPKCTCKQWHSLSLTSIIFGPARRPGREDFPHICHIHQHTLLSESLPARIQMFHISSNPCSWPVDERILRQHCLWQHTRCRSEREGGLLSSSKSRTRQLLHVSMQP